MFFGEGLIDMDVFPTFHLQRPYPQTALTPKQATDSYATINLQSSYLQTV